MKEMTQPNDGSSDDGLSQLDLLRSHLGAGQFGKAASIVTGLHEADVAFVLRELSGRDRGRVIELVPVENTARIIGEQNIDDAAKLIEGLDDVRSARILDLASPDVAVDVIRRLSPKKTESTLGLMATADSLTLLLQYPDDTAGGLMLPEPATIREWMTAEEAIGFLRGTRPRSETSNYLFVLDRLAALEGVVSLRDMVLAPAQTLVRDLMDSQVRSVQIDTDQEECARVMGRYDLVQLPVVDQHKHILGVILAEDIIDVIQQEATEDMLRLAAVSGTERVSNPLSRAVRDRIPWLLLNLGTVLAASVIINVFESTIAAAAFLVVFLPMVASQGGVAGSQTLTLVTRGLALGDLNFGNTKRILLKEAGLGVASGVASGVIVGVIAWVWKESFSLGIVVGVAMLLNLIVAGVFGAVVPLFMRALRLDPALGSAVVVTTITDMAGFALVLGLAAWWLVS